jgi:60 kDa SS-A/Ro ribonucleoprotein
MPSVAAAIKSVVRRWEDLERFLVLGASDGVYYAGEPRLSAERAHALRECLAEDGARVVRAIVEAAGVGRAPRPDPLLFALALAASPAFADAEVNAAALSALPRVAQSSAQLQNFVGYVTAHRGWGRSLRSAIAQWYLEMPVRELARQMLHQRRHSRWSHADLLRLSHPTPENTAQSILFRWAVQGDLSRASSDLLGSDLKQIYGFELAKKAADRYEIVELIEAYQLTPEMIPERWLASAGVWEALLDSMPYCAILRNLDRLTKAGLLAPQGEATALVAARLVDQKRIARAKINPVTLLTTFLRFRERHEVPAIAAALESALYASFANVPPSGRRIGVAMDGAAPVASTILGMIAVRTENGAKILPSCIERDHGVDAAMAAVGRIQRQPDFWPDVEAMVVISGRGGWIAPARLPGVPLVVVAPDATEPEGGYGHDPSVLQILGFDATVPRAIVEFFGV